jgi:hypothetical protein
MSSRRSPKGEGGQAFIETLLMIWLLTLLLSAILQVFLIHNYTFQMANNAYYSLFKDKAYGEYSSPDKGFQGFPNWPKKPLRTVKALDQAGGKVHVLAGGGVNWSEDDRAAVPMMPFYEDPIVEQLENYGVTRAPVRLKIGNPAAGGQNYLDMKFLHMAMGTDGGFGPFFDMIGSIIQIAGELGQNYTDFTGGYTDDDLDDMFGDYEGAEDDLDDQDADSGQKAKDQWDNAHGDFNHDGYRDACEAVQGDNDPDCRNHRPWE